MRKFSYLILAGALFAGVSCATDLSEVYNRLDQLEQKVQNLERLNSTVNGLYTIVSSFENNVYVETVTETEEGYVIKFTDGKTATIKNGDKGPKGDPGDPGAPGETPSIGVADENGQLVWTVNGNVIKDESGKSVPASVSVPEFKFDNNKWWYRFGATDSWKDCGEKTGPEPSIIETDEFVVITIGDKSIQIPKEVISPAIEAIKPVLIPRNNLFVPVGKTVDLKDFFDVEPEGALKSMVEYTYAETAPFTISEKGILEVTGPGSNAVTISAKVNPELKMTMYIRSAECPNDEMPASTVEADDIVKIYTGSLEEYNSLVESGGSTAFNPLNGAHAAIANGGNINFRLGLEVVPNSKFTMENARLHFMFYVSDPSTLQSAPYDGIHFLEVTSSSTYDKDEVNFELPLFVPDLKAGWNEVDLPFSAATNPGNGTFDVTNVNFIRFICPVESDSKWIAFQVKDLYAYIDNSKITEIKPVLIPRNNLFVPVGKSADLKDFFEVVPAKLGKSGVTYTPADGAPFTVSEDGIVEVTGPGSYAVTIASKENPDIKMTMYIRSAECPNDEMPASEVDADEIIKIYTGSLEEYNSLVESGGSTAFNPINGAHAAIANGGNINFRLGLEVKPNTKLTMENAHLHFMFYVSDPSTLQSAPYDGVHFLEVTSSSTYDKDEVNFELPLFVPGLKAGWNEVDLPFSAATNPGNGTFDVTNVNFIRFICPVESDSKWIAFQVKDLYAYAEPEPAHIIIDGDLSDWANVKGVTNPEEGATYLEFKMASDENNIYFYTKRVANSALWNGGGYLYYALDYDNNIETGDGDIWGNKPYECIFVIWPFAGTGDAPAFAEKPLGESMMKPSGSLANYNANGKADASGVELEFSIPRADFPTIPDSEITVYAWGNKSGENMKNFPLKIKL